VARLVAPQSPLLVVLPGPTASGKTVLSLQLAERFNGEIVSCDSVAVYRDFEIGTAKPTLAERQRVPHHLIDIASPAVPYSAGEYSRDARAAIADIVARRRLPIVTGGTGLYLRALLLGLFAGPPRVAEMRVRLRKAEERHGPGYLHRLLSRRDRVAGSAIHPNDLPKLIRAIEVSLMAGRPMTEAWSEGRDALTGYRILRIGLEPERKLLYERINLRAERMFAAGLIEETQALLQKYGKDLKLFDALGYRQAATFLRGEYSRETALQLAQQGHRNFAKRQLTWFRREPDTHWLHGFGDGPETGEAARTLVQAALETGWL
jgi:tRNA dimethylallyltransferase